MVRLIFNEKVTENGCLWVFEWCMDVLFIVEKSTKPALEKKKKRKKKAKAESKPSLHIEKTWVISLNH